MSDLNYFSYHSEIEETFTSERGKHLMIGPLDWALIDSWQERGIPLHVVERSIKEVFAKHKSAAKKNAINSLRYCQAEVELQYEQWRATQVGKHQSEPPAVAGGQDRSPFAKDAVLDYLEEVGGKLSGIVLKCASERQGSPAMELLATKLGYVIGFLNSARARFEAEPNMRVLEEALTPLDIAIAQALEESAGPKQLAEARAAAEALFEPYKGKMPPQVYQQQIDNELKKRLRALFGVPRLSLFHMKG